MNPENILFLIRSILVYGVVAFLGTPALRPYYGFLAQYAAVMDLLECI